MPKVIDLKTKNQLFDSWIKEVIELHKLDEGSSKVGSAVFMWETKDEDGSYSAHTAYLNADLAELEWYQRCFNKMVQERQIADFLRRHIGDFIQYIEE